MKATVKAAELLPALSMTIPHSATDTTIPDLYGLQFMLTGDNRLEVLACDRYTLGVYTIPLEADSKPVDGVFTLPLPDARDWLKIVKSANSYRANNPDLTITALFDDAQIGTATLDHPGGLARVKVTTRNPVRWGQLVSQPAKDGFGPAEFGVDPKHMVKFTKTHKGCLRVQLPADPAKTLRIFDTTDDRFFGLIMPVRLTKEEDQ